MKPLVMTKEDLLAVFRLNWIRSFRINKWKFLAFELVALILTVILLAVVLIVFKGVFKMPTVMLIVYGLGLILLLPFIVLCKWFITFPFLAKQQIRKNKILSIPYTITWDETYLYISSEQTDGKLAWSVFIDMIENDGYILLYSQSQMFHVVAKRYFDSTEEMENFLHTAKAGMDINPINQ